MDLSDEELEFLGSVFELARRDGRDQLVTLIESGLPVNLTNSAGDSLLMLAAYYNHTETVMALLALGADTARVNDRGQTALGAAVFRRNKECVAALLDAGADPELGERSANLLAGFFGLSEMQSLLSRAPLADPDMRPSD